MLVFYGSKGKILAEKQLQINCPACQQSGMDFAVVGSYAHLYWIPMFPLGKSVVAVCPHCSQAWKENEMPADIKQYAKAEKSTSRRPIWFYSGLILIAIFFVFIAISAHKGKQDDIAFINAPAVGDVYTYKLDEGGYTLLRVVKVDGNTVSVVQNQYKVDRSSGVSKLRSKPYYNDPEDFSLAELKEEYDQNRITDVDR